MPSAAVVVSHELESCTQEVRAFGCLHPNGSGRKIVLIDTPGFDDTDRTDYDILRSITQWLKVTSVSYHISFQLSTTEFSAPTSDTKGTSL